MKESFVFYASFFRAIEELDDKKQLILYKSIMNLALKNEENENLKGIEKAIFELIKPQILANNRRYEDGCKGGRPKKIKTTGFENEKPMVLKKEKNKKPNDNVNDNDNVNENVNENDNDNVNENVVNFSRTQNFSSYKTYGEYSNVYLTDMQRNEIDTMTMDKKAAISLIDELSINIARNKAPFFDDSHPDMHVATLKAYWNYKRKNQPAAIGSSKKSVAELMEEVKQELENEKQQR